jgi:NADH:ubiquinone oxidoreductase subunit K
MAAGGMWIKRGTQVLLVIALCCAGVTLGLAVTVWNYPAPGDISTSLDQRPGTYTLALDHMKDLTLASFAYLRTPLVVAGVAFIVGAVGMFRAGNQRAFVAAAVMMVLFFQAARLALLVFDPYLSSRPIAEALIESPPGQLVIDHHYYTYSSVFFYTNRTALLLNGRTNNLIYGSYAPGAPDIFIDDAEFRLLWLAPKRCYLVVAQSALPHLKELVGAAHLHQVLLSGGKLLLRNLP